MKVRYGDQNTNKLVFMHQYGAVVAHRGDHQRYCCLLRAVRLVEYWLVSNADTLQMKNYRVRRNQSIAAGIDDGHFQVVGAAIGIYHL